MIRAQHIVIIFSMVCLCLKVGSLYGQVDSIEMEEQLSKALNLMDAFQNEPALDILEDLETKLSKQDALNTVFGYKVQDRLAEVLEREDRDEEAIIKLIKLSEETEDKALWDIYANTQLSLARLHEKLGREESCIKFLRLAANVIDEHDVKEHYPRYTIRISSYHRIFGDRDSSRYFAKEAVRSATELGQDDQIGTGRLLLGLLTYKDSYLEAVDHFKAAGEIWYGLGDFSGYSYIQHNLAKLHYENGEINLARLHNDSTFIAAKATEKMGHDHRPILQSAYQFRSQLNELDGQLDSALVNAKRAQELQLDIVYSSNADKIAEIDAKYNDDLKSKKIKDQQELLDSEKKRKTLRQILFGILIFFSSLIGIFYFRLLAAIKRIRKQSNTIRETNLQLKKSLKHSQVLQSELHHRVKNNLQTIIGLCELQSKSIDDPMVKEKLGGMKQRIYGMAATHEAFNVNAENDADVGSFLTSISNNFKSSTQIAFPIQINQEVDDFDVNMETLMPLGMILHELMTNSVKHFSNASNELIISIQLLKESDTITLLYKDNGPGFQSGIMESREGGIGNYLINSMVRQLNGQWETSNENGAKFKILIKEKNKT